VPGHDEIGRTVQAQGSGGRQVLRTTRREDERRRIGGAGGKAEKSAQAKVRGGGGTCGEAFRADGGKWHVPRQVKERGTVQAQGEAGQ